jgi:hypothetical protein
VRKEKKKLKEKERLVKGLEASALQRYNESGKSSKPKKALVKVVMFRIYRPLLPFRVIRTERSPKN